MSSTPTSCTTGIIPNTTGTEDESTGLELEYMYAATPGCFLDKRVNNPVYRHTMPAVVNDVGSGNADKGSVPIYVHIW